MLLSVFAFGVRIWFVFDSVIISTSFRAYWYEREWL